MQEYQRREYRAIQLQKNNIQLIYKKSKIKIVIGAICLGIAIFPNGLGVLFYPLGLSLLISGGVDIYTPIKKYKNKLRFALWKIRG